MRGPVSWAEWSADVICFATSKAAAGGTTPCPRGQVVEVENADDVRGPEPRRHVGLATKAREVALCLPFDGENLDGHLLVGSRRCLASHTVSMPPLPRRPVSSYVPSLIVPSRMTGACNPDGSAPPVPGTAIVDVSERSMSVSGSRCGCPRMRAASYVSTPAATSAMQPSTRLLPPELIAGIDAPTRSLQPTGPVIVSETTPSLRVDFALRRRSSLPSIPNRTCAPSRSSRSAKDDSGASASIKSAPFSSAARLGSRQSAATRQAARCARRRAGGPRRRAPGPARRGRRAAHFPRGFPNLSRVGATASPTIATVAVAVLSAAMLTSCSMGLVLRSV